MYDGGEHLNTLVLDADQKRRLHEKRVSEFGCGVRIHDLTRLCYELSELDAVDAARFFLTCY